jgi:chaperone required for assembly of F1-ATPase
VFLTDLVSGWIVTLDGRMMKTPDDNRFLLPSEELAYLVAGEWEAQDSKIRPITMPMVIKCIIHFYIRDYFGCYSN